MKVIWSKLAGRLLDDIHDYIALDYPERASRFAGELGRAPRRLADQPRSGRVVPELGDPDLFEIIYKGYRILYRIESHIEVVAVADGRQDLETLAKRYSI